MITLTEIKVLQRRVGEIHECGSLFDETIAIDVNGDYTEEVAKAMAERGAKNNYTTKVVANPDKEGDFGVIFSQRRKEGLYVKPMFEGKFTGIGKAGLIPNSKLEKDRKSLAEKGDEKNKNQSNVEMSIPLYSGEQGAFSMEVSASVLLKDAKSNKTIVTDRRGKELGAKYSTDLFEVSANETGKFQVDILLGNFAIGYTSDGQLALTGATSDGKINSSATIFFDPQKASDNMNRFVLDIGKAFIKNLNSYNSTPIPNLIPFFVIPSFHEY